MAKLKVWKFFSVWMVLVLVAALGAVLVPASPVQAATWYVDGAGTDDGTHGTGTGANAFKTIQYAINDGRVVASDVINVAAGTYNEALTINKGLTLRGAGSGVTTVTGAQTITVSNVTVDGFTLNGGIAISDTATAISGVTISNNRITGAQYGIRVGLGAGLGVNGVTIDRNTITANTRRGILFYNAGDYAAQHVSNVTISGNEITNNTDGGTQGGGISTYGPGPNTIINNIVSGNNGNGISIKYDGGDIVRGNTVTNNTAMGINMHEVTTCVVENNTVSGHLSEGVVTNFWGAPVVAGKGSGIYIHEYAVNNTIRYNTITGNRNGILINREVAGTDPSANSITFNNIAGNTLYGILNTLPATLVNATNNWWGANDGPGVVGPGSGDKVSANVNYTPWLRRESSTTSATGTGTVTFDVSAGGITGLTAVAEATLRTAGKPAGVSFPHGLFSFNIVGITPGSCVIVTITFPSPIHAGTQYWKCQGGVWIDCTSLLGDDDGDNVLTLRLCDGGLGDADGVANGTIVDPGGLGVPVPVQGATVPRTSPSLPRQLKPAQMSVLYMSVSPQQTSANQPVTITTNVVNTGDQSGNYNVALKINGQVEQSRMVSVGPQGTQPVKLTVTKAQPGTYTVDIGGQRGSFVVLGAGGTAGAPVNGGLIAILIMGVLILTTVVVLLATFRRRAC